MQTKAMHTRVSRPALMLVASSLALLSIMSCEVKGSPTTDVQNYQPPPAAASYMPPAATPQARRFIILHTNDEHSHIFGFGPETLYTFLPTLHVDTTVSPPVTTVAATTPTDIVTKLASGHDQKTVGGLVRRQYLINKIRGEATDPVLLLSAGDSMMGTVMHLASTASAPDYVLMALLGYDFMTIGNHDFDWGPEAFAKTIAAGQKMIFGGIVPIVSSNIHFGDVRTASDSGAALKALYGDPGSGADIVPWATKTLANGLKIGFLGLLGYNASSVAVSKGKVRFSVPHGTIVCNTDADCAAAGDSCRLGTCVSSSDAAGYYAALYADAQAAVDTLRQSEKIDVVVALTHLGIYEDNLLGENTQGIDVIIGGHSHTEVVPTVVTSQLHGQSIIVQAGSYGTKLGELDVVVAPDGSVSYDAATSTLHDVSYHLDAEIAADTNAVEDAIALTVGVIGPVLAGINDNFYGLLAGVFGVPTLMTPLIASDHDVIGSVMSQDNNLAHMVTDSEFSAAALGACPAGSVIAVESNGFLRDSLLFDPPPASGPVDPSVSVADIFRVVPLGASPYDSHWTMPGFPLVMFQLYGVELYASMEVGVNQGLVNSDFFLSYSGAQITYDASLEPFSADALSAGHEPGGRILKIALGANDTYSTIIYERNAGDPWASGWRIDPNIGSGPLLTLVSHYYLAAFLSSFDLVPRNAAGVQVDDLSQFVLCQNPEPHAFSCNTNPTDATFRYCADINTDLGIGAAPPWGLAPTASSPSGTPVYEAKEWTVLVSTLATIQQQAGGLGPTQYVGASPSAATLRVIPTP